MEDVDRQLAACKERVSQWADICMVHVLEEGWASGQPTVYFWRLVPKSYDFFLTVPGARVAKVDLSVDTREFQYATWLELIRARWQCSILELWELCDPNKEFNRSMLEAAYK